VAGLSETTIREVLENLGLTGKEAEVYIFLAKRGPLKGVELAKQLKKHKAQIYRILKRLQTKGLLESTLEATPRFTAVPFEKVLDQFIKIKQEEAAFIERTKEDWLKDWERINKARIQPTTEKFAVIEGSKKIYSKIAEMIENTTIKLSAISTVKDLVRAEQFGVFDSAYNHPFKTEVKFRFLTEINNQNLKAIKLLKTKLRAELDFKGRNPDLGLSLFPRMVVRDEEEILFFISTRTGSLTKGREVCLSTNCKSLVQAFSNVFEDLWRNSTNIEKKIEEIETGIKAPRTFIIDDAGTAKNSYSEIVNSANEEILMMTSSEGLIGLYKNLDSLKGLAEKDVSIKVLAPILNKNLEATQHLSKFCEIRHTPLSYVQTTLVDGEHLFQFKTPPFSKEVSESSIFESTFYSNDSKYVKRTRIMFNDLWKRAQSPSKITLDSITSRKSRTQISIPEETDYSLYFKIMGWTKDPKSKALHEKDIIEKIVNAKKYPGENWKKDVLRYYGSSAKAIIHPPKNFGLPDLIIDVLKFNSQSSFGAENILSIYLMNYGTVATVQTNPAAIDYRKKAVFANTPAENNIQLLKKDEEFQVRIQGNTLFCAWTTPIPLIKNYILPPACILFEGHGELKTGIIHSSINNRKQVTEYNILDAFVTFFHPSSKYSGPGTDGYFARDLIFTAIP
jgi:sugar-specific transcriptional regulator TrmB